MRVWDALKHWVSLGRRPVPPPRQVHCASCAPCVFQGRKTACLWCDETQDWRRCLLINLTETGAEVELFDNTLPSPLPKRWVTLCIAGDDAEADCEVIWRKGRRIGMRVSGGFRPISRYPPAAAG